MSCNQDDSKFHSLIKTGDIPRGHSSAVTGHFKMHHLWPLQSAPPWERLRVSLMAGLCKGGFAWMRWFCWRGCALRSALGEAVAAAFDGEDFGMVQQPIQDGSGGG